MENMSDKLCTCEVQFEIKEEFSKYKKSPTKENITLARNSL